MHREQALLVQLQSLPVEVRKQLGLLGVEKGAVKEINRLKQLVDTTTPRTAWAVLGKGGVA